MLCKYYNPCELLIFVGFNNFQTQSFWIFAESFFFVKSDSNETRKKTKQCEMSIKNLEKKIQWQFSPSVF